MRWTLPSSRVGRAIVIPAVVFVLCVSLAAAAGDEEELYHVFGSVPSSNFGFAVAAVPDADQDGVTDFLVGAPGNGIGYAAVYSGADGQLVGSWNGATNYDGFGGAVASAGDLDGDGIADFLIGAIRATDPTSGLLTGSVTLYSGADASALRTWYGGSDREDFGVNLANLGDVDGDGVDDFLVGAPFASYVKLAGGAAYLYSGATGALIVRLDGPGKNNQLATAIAAVGDVDHDGFGDFAVGIPGRDTAVLTDCGSVWVYSGATQQRLYTIFGDQTQLHLGKAVSGGVDADGDGTPDLLIGAPDWAGSYFGQGIVRLCSGVDGSLLWERAGIAGYDYFGSTVALTEAGGEIALLASAVGPGRYDRRVERRDPTSGRLVHSWQAPQLDDDFGRSLANLGDVNGDGFADLAIGAGRSDDGSQTNPGAVRIERGSDLWLDAEPKQAGAGATMVTSIARGTTGKATIRFVVDVSGTPVFYSLPPLTTFDADGFAVFVETVPPGLAGITATLRAYAIRADGRLIDSNDEVITLL